MTSRINVAMTNEYVSRFGDAPDMVAVDVAGLAVEDMEHIRNGAREKSVEMFIVKNSLATRVLTPKLQNAPKLENDGLAAMLQGQTALVWGAEMPDLVRFVFEQAKKTGRMAVRGGLFEKQVMKPEDIERFRAIPDRPTLLAQTLATIIAPLTQLLGATNALLTSPAALADALARKKEES